MVYFSQLKGKPVLDSADKKIGILVDMGFNDGEKYAEISHVIYISKNNYRKKIPWSLVKEIKDSTKTRGLEADIHLNSLESEIEPTFEKEKEFTVSKLIDKQIIDVDGLKVVRVNDVFLGKVGCMFCIVAVCVGAKSLLRSLAGEKLSETFVGKMKDHIIPWEFVESLDPEIQKLHIKLKKSKIADLHPADIADLMEDLTYKERELVFNSLDRDKAAKTIIESEPEIQKSFLKSMKMNSILEILENIPPNHAADLISLMTDDMKNEILHSMKPESARRVKEILGYTDTSVGSIMHTEFIAIPSSYTAENTIELMRKLKPSSDKVYRMYVVDEKQKLLGYLPVGNLVTAPADEKIEKLMKNKIISMQTTTSKEDAAKALVKYNLFTVPVVDENGVLKGVVKANDVISEVLPRAWKRKRYFAPERRKHGFRNNGNASKPVQSN
ncbi:MAG: CBS domain-containing protein [Candidatus Aenigmarchaeota archaeon]|nr:CBS domain-containing protein [Candidatus Aenigmarchaeota archaeon]